jgi:hypothetical protein
MQCLMADKPKDEQTDQRTDGKKDEKETYEQKGWFDNQSAQLQLTKKDMGSLRVNGCVLEREEFVYVFSFISHSRRPYQLVRIDSACCTESFNVKYCPFAIWLIEIWPIVIAILLVSWVGGQIYIYILYR